MKVIFKNTSLVFQTPAPPTPRKASMESGSINGLTGEDVVQSTRLRTSGYFEVTGFPIVIKASSSNYANAVVASIVCYDSSKVLKGYAITKEDNTNNSISWGADDTLSGNKKVVIGNFLRVIFASSEAGSDNLSVGDIEMLSEETSGLVFDNTNSVEISS